MEFKQIRLIRLPSNVDEISDGWYWYNLYRCVQEFEETHTETIIEVVFEKHCILTDYVCVVIYFEGLDDYEV